MPKDNHHRHRHHVQHRTWLPKNQHVVEGWLESKLERLDHPDVKSKPLHPVIKEFQDLIEGDPGLYMCFHMMFEQIPNKPPFNEDPTMHEPQVRNYKTMLALFNLLIEEAPEFEEGGGVGLPINAILDWPMGTDAGISAFLNPKVNAMFKKLLDTWAKFLSSPDSRYVLTNKENGWFGAAATKAIGPDFAETFVCEPNQPHYGFHSWDAFFTREFRPGRRPVQFPENDSIINSACESRVYNIATDVKSVDKFWIKEEPYSLRHMLNHDPLTAQFIGGTVYQAFLSALKYHRWHSPVNGTIEKVVMVPGSYYAESPAMGFHRPEGPDPTAQNLSQAFITAVATRALIFIKANNPNIGLMCFVGVGMAEVSSCDVTVQVGQRVKKGDQLGMFHFGGSTYCLVFRKQTRVEFNPDYPVGNDVPLSAALGTVGARQDS